MRSKIFLSLLFSAICFSSVRGFATETPGQLSDGREVKQLTDAELFWTYQWSGIKTIYQCGYGASRVIFTQLLEAASGTAYIQAEDIKGGFLSPVPGENTETKPPLSKTERVKITFKKLGSGFEAMGIESTCKTTFRDLEYSLTEVFERASRQVENKILPVVIENVTNLLNLTTTAVKENWKE